eukprot:413761-Rhodomonas_salina.5
MCTTSVPCISQGVPITALKATVSVLTWRRQYRNFLEHIHREIKDKTLQSYGASSYLEGGLVYH